MTVEMQIRALDQLNSAQLRQRWQEIAGSPIPNVSLKLLRLALAHRLQTKAFGDLPPAAHRKLAQIASGGDTAPRVRTGMRLVRDWKGTTHVVTIDEHGVICWNDRTWPSLSAVACTITGSHWSGPAFFGLGRSRS